MRRRKASVLSHSYWSSANPMGTFLAPGRLLLMPPGYRDVNQVSRYRMMATVEEPGGLEGRAARELLKWARANRRDFPWRLETDPYRLVVTELMLVRTRAEQVEPVWTAFFERYPSLISLAQADEEEIWATLKPLGLAWRARRVIEFAHSAVETRNWQGELESLPGAGPYVRAAVRVGAAGRGELPVDVTIARVIGRYFGIHARGEARRSASVLDEAKSMGSRSRRFFHAWLDLAALVCRPTQPACQACPLNLTCRSAADRSDRWRA